ncbi:hypothetical protein M2155_000564 [Streptomyces sp. SAI-119]|uniref:DUF6221 family protein n=1 Tax=Streptomyces sp. SAI-119 TaxID=2940541 RepID=UPI002475DF88|nr:DUF6221 family protein [Streptomyces sp. SAI-119]MDH6448156.1 hypothetical protein [Streptomyces sp. SAI-119]
MSDLHGWLTRQVDRVEALARAAEKEQGRDWRTRWEASGDHFEIVDDAGLLVADQMQPGAAAQAVAHDPAAVLRRCAADRKILADHTALGFDGSVHCDGCGIDYESGPLVENVNDCPTLLALAEGYGLTPEALAGLERALRPEPKRRGGILPTNVGATADIPPALRGPNWKGQR